MGPLKARWGAKRGLRLSTRRRRWGKSSRSNLSRVGSGWCRSLSTRSRGRGRRRRTRRQASRIAPSRASRLQPGRGRRPRLYRQAASSFVGRAAEASRASGVPKALSTASKRVALRGVSGPMRSRTTGGKGGCSTNRSRRRLFPLPGGPTRLRRAGGFWKTRWRCSRRASSSGPKERRTLRTRWTSTGPSPLASLEPRGSVSVPGARARVCPSVRTSLGSASLESRSARTTGGPSTVGSPAWPLPRGAQRASPLATPARAGRGEARTILKAVSSARQGSWPRARGAPKRTKTPSPRKRWTNPPWARAMRAASSKAS